MKYLIYVVIIVSITINVLYAQFDDYYLDFKADIKSNDGKQIFVLFNRGNVNDGIDGYILITRAKHNIEGSIQKSGFNFLDPKIFELGIEKLRRKWVENNFPIKDIESMTNGVDVEKVYTFEITPEILNIHSDTLSFYIKGAFYNLAKPNDNLDSLNLKYNINFSYKLLKIPFNKTVPLDFANEQFMDYSCSIIFTKIKKSEEYLSIHNNQYLFDGIKQSDAESELPPDIRFKIEAEYLRNKAKNPAELIAISPDNYLLRVKQHSLKPFNTLVEKQYAINAGLPVEAYNTELVFPFQLYNDEKSELYENYKTKKEIFQSKCNVIVVPISLDDDTLTADIFLNYSKITLDNIPRWTPIKKRVKIIQGFPLAINLPKENWSANFVRDDEKYDIYGYSDFERYVNEYLIISFDSVKQTKGDLK
jgi:hypothetical protein